jgi:uncharacterized integral membrane protein
LQSSAKAHSSVVAQVWPGSLIRQHGGKRPAQGSQRAGQVLIALRFATTSRCEQAVDTPIAGQLSMSTNARKFRIAAIFIVIVLVLLVIWQNSEMTTLKLLMFSAELPLMLWLGLFLLTGVLLGVALMWSDRRRRE